MTKTIKRVCGVVGIVVAAAAFVTVAEHVGVSTVEAAQAKRTSSLKGVIKTIDETSVVIVPNENRKVEVTFRVTADTTREGAVTPGDEVTVSYHFEQTQRVATALAGKTK